MAKNVLFEIGLEELPARFIDDSEKLLGEKTEQWLNDLRISFSKVETFSSPRRLAVLIHDMNETQETIEEEAKGPALKVAKDNEGNWTKAAIGFTRGQGKTTDDIYTKDLKGTTYIYVNKVIEGKPTYDLLPQFKEIIESIPFGKNMRWGEQTMRYARPIRWLVALYGNEVIPFEIAHVETNNTTFGHRFLSGKLTINNPEDYKLLLKENYVLVDPTEREKLIVEGIKKIEAEKNVLIPIDQQLMNEVRNLVEYPTVFIGSFEEEFLKLPAEVLITSMKEHQRYFPVKSSEGELLPYFIGVRNGDANHIETVIKGNEKVLRARLSDAQFFYEEDQKNSIDFYLEKLESVVFQEKLGTISDKVNRVAAIAEKIAVALKLNQVDLNHIGRAAKISKFDLMTNMVNEFTELQGIIGEKYAHIFGEDDTVATAIKEHYMPTSAGGKLPETIVGSVVSVAEKLDTIVGCIGVGLKPTGSQDPYGLRRQAIGILRIANDREWEIEVSELFQIALNHYKEIQLEHFDASVVNQELHSFIQQRVAFVLKENGIEQDIIHAITNHGIGEMASIMKKATILSAKRNDANFKSTQEALVRVLNLAEKTEETVVNEEYFETDSEANLYKMYNQVQQSFEKLVDQDEFEKAFAELEQLAEPIHAFFDNNMVMSDNETIKRNRLALLKRIAQLLNSFADLNVIEWKQHF
ncbi:glycine--tRNA ligase subunit beta [Ornithinibacillus halotolerans]|uniref:Glycine--tRNA ligase beta subunit n=1 Tax=Ornithinibacillus halotolerans TaxID=1274357 RepID=A0A916RTE9_9BACI|nr:glycine--tRNA ligase subunit beta [Ornithinibacillus halotolerans]GGA68588.1 glycine--tRNA ligase beta subunit [Ornithinibacillus halotolerans]